MDSSAATTSPESQRESKSRKKWVEPITALVMALATVGTAWCSFESAAWTRRSNRLMNEFNSLERKAGILNVQGMQTATIHAAMFMQLLAAKQAGNEVLANAYVDVSRPICGKRTMRGSPRNHSKIQRPILIRLYRISTRCAAHVKPLRQPLSLQPKSSRRAAPVTCPVNISPTLSYSRPCSFLRTQPESLSSAGFAPCRLFSRWPCSHSPSCASQSFRSEL